MSSILNTMKINHNSNPTTPNIPQSNSTINSPSFNSPSFNPRNSLLQPTNLVLSNSTLNIPESCEFCSITLCKKCELCSNNCHYYDLSGPNKNINSYIHCNNNKTVIVDSNRLLFTNENIDCENLNLVSISSASASPAFNSFYNQFKGLARRFEIFDAEDVNLWKDKLTYKYAYLFSDSKFALITLKQHAFLKKDALGPLISFNFCTPCNSYQIVYPESRVKHSSKLNEYYLPNFYSTSICRKNNAIHDKARSTSTFIHMQNIRSSSIGNSPLTSPRLNSLMMSTAASPIAINDKRNNSFTATPRGSFSQQNADNPNFKLFSVLPTTALNVDAQQTQIPMSPNYDKKPNLFSLSSSKAYNHLEISAAINKSINQSSELHARRESENTIKSPLLRGLSLRDEFSPKKTSRSNSFKDPNLPVSVSAMFLPIFTANIATNDPMNVSNGFSGVKYLNEISEYNFPKVLQNKSISFEEKVSLSLIEERHYKYFLEYLEKFPIVFFYSFYHLNLSQLIISI